MDHTAPLSHSDHNAMSTICQTLQAGGRLAANAPYSGPIASDYDARWFLLTHGICFPNGTGQLPKGMTLERWLIKDTAEPIPSSDKHKCPVCARCFQHFPAS